jgi:hypothetical protein
MTDQGIPLLATKQDLVISHDLKGARFTEVYALKFVTPPGSAAPNTSAEKSGRTDLGSISEIAAAAAAANVILVPSKRKSDELSLRVFPYSWSTYFL